MNRSLLIALILTISSLISLIVTASFAQIPDTYTNLKVLPKDIKKAQLMQYMKDFSKALGVRCHACHKGEEGQSPIHLRLRIRRKTPAKTSRAS